MLRLQNPLATGGLIGLLVGSSALGAYAVLNGDATSDIFRFITLLIIFMAALALTATVFFGLKMANAEEAFGLPTGSVRALLAIGIMILFVVFGLPLISSSNRGPARLAREPLQTTTVPHDRDGAAIQQHAAQGLVAVVTQYGRPATPGPPVDAGAPATMQIYERVQTRPEEELDLARQMLTAIVTLLTTVVGFYFGSRSASEVSRHAEPTQEGAAAAAQLTAVRLLRSQELERLNRHGADLGANVDRLKADAAITTDPARNAKLDEAVAARAQTETQLAEIAARLAAADAAIGSLSASKSAADLDQYRRAASDELKAIEDQLSLVREVQARYAEKVQAV